MDARVLIAFLFIAFIFIIYQIGISKDNNVPLLISAGVMFFGMLYSWRSMITESLVDQRLREKRLVPADGDVQNATTDLLQFDDQDYDLSSFGNESETHNAQPLPLDKDILFGDPNATFKKSYEIDAKSKMFDNSDVVETVIRGSSEYEPRESESTNFYRLEDLVYKPKINMAAKSFLGPEGPVYAEYHQPINGRAISADDKLTRRQQHISLMNKRAIDGAVRATKNQFSKYFQNELNEASAREWWDDEEEDAELDFHIVG